MDKTITRLQAKIDKAYAEIKTFQDSCAHPGPQVRYQFDSNTGNYDGYEAYWTRNYCGKCGKHWNVDSSISYPGGTRVGYGEDLTPKESR